MAPGKVEAESTEYCLVLVGNDQEELDKACHNEVRDSIWISPHLEKDWIAYIIRELDERRVGRLQTILQEDYDLRIFLSSSLNEAKKIVKSVLQFEK